MAFQPDPTQLTALAADLGSRCSHVYIFANSPLDDALTEALHATARISVIRSESNRGIGHALNVLAERAYADGHDQILLFDQDSTIEPSTLPNLLWTWRNLVKQGRRPAAVGPAMVPPEDDRERYKCPRVFPHGGEQAQARALPVWFIPTSGTLLDLTAFRAVGPFRDDYFIDGVDIEWCFRAWSVGYTCWLARSASLIHRVGKGRVKLPTGGYTPDQDDSRMATYLRNSVYGLRLRHVPLFWKLLQLAYIPLQVAATWRSRGYRRSYLALLAKAAANGLAGRLGPPPSFLDPSPAEPHPKRELGH